MEADERLWELNFITKHSLYLAQSGVLNEFIITGVAEREDVGRRPDVAISSLGDKTHWSVLPSPRSR